MYNNWNLKIDLEGKRYKIIYRLLGIPLGGEWKPLFDVQQVTLTKLDMKKTYNSSRTMGNSSTLKVEMYVVFLKGLVKSQFAQVYKNESLSEAKAMATDVSEYLAVELKDNTVEQTLPG